MSEKEEQYRKVNELYNQFSYMFYESMHKSGRYTKLEVNKHIDKLIRSLTVLKNIK